MLIRNSARVFPKRAFGGFSSDDVRPLQAPIRSIQVWREISDDHPQVLLTSLTDDRASLSMPKFCTKE